MGMWSPAPAARGRTNGDGGYVLLRPRLSSVLLLGLLSIASSSLTGGSSHHAATQLGANGGSTSGHWSGYVLHGGQGKFTSITGQWQVPTIAASAQVSDLSTWIGIGGYSTADPQLIQIGTEENATAGAPVDYAFYERVTPKPGSQIHLFKVNPGDTVSAGIKRESSGWSLAIEDITTGARPTPAIPNRSFSGLLTTAEWIDEAPLGQSGVTSLADFGVMTFAQLTVNGNSSHLTSSERLVMIYQGRQLSTPSLSNRQGNAFTVAYGEHTPQPPPSGFSFDPLEWHVASLLPFNDGYLAGASCVSADDCWAVGGFAEDGPNSDLVHYNGRTWQFYPSPIIPTSVETNILESVACTGPNSCWAVGEANDQALLEHYNGTAWSVVSSPSVSGAGGLDGIACTSSTDCWAVGGSPTQPVIVRLVDGTWMAAASPPEPSGSGLDAIACFSPSNCWAVGEGGGSSLAPPPLIEHWNGTTWATVVSPSVTATADYDTGLTSISCPAANDCWAAGDGIVQVLHYSDGHWTAVDAPLSDSSAVPTSVACTSQADCWAVGGNQLLHLVGATWQVVSSPSSMQAGAFSAISCYSASECWALGSQPNGNDVGVPSFIETNYQPTASSKR